MTDRTGTGGQDLGGVPSSRAERLAWQRQAAALLGKMLASMFRDLDVPG
jgi:hypothetical protein